MVPTFVKDKASGQLRINPRKFDTQFFQLVPDGAANPVVVGAGLTSPPILFTVSQDGPFEAYYLTHFRVNATDVFVTIYDEAAKRMMMNNEVHIDTIFGTRPLNGAMGPFVLPETLFMHVSRSLVMRFRDAAAGNTIYPVVSGTRFYGFANPSKELVIAMDKRAARGRVSTPYFQTTDAAVAIPGVLNAQVNAFMTVTAEGHFEWCKTTCISTGAIGIQVFDPRNGRSLSNGMVHVGGTAGSASFPFILPEKTLFQANSQIRVQFTNLTGAPNNVYFTATGRKIYIG